MERTFTHSSTSSRKHYKVASLSGDGRMSRYLLLFADDVPESVWLLRHEVPFEAGEALPKTRVFIPRAFYVPGSGKIELRPQYEHLRCPACKKVNEGQALALGVSNDVRIQSRRELF